MTQKTEETDISLIAEIDIKLTKDPCALDNI